MIFASARLAFADIFSAPFRGALWKALGLSAIVLVALWFGIAAIAEWVAVPFLSNLFPDAPSWVDQAGSLAGWAAGFALAILLAFLIGPISAVIASLFLDDVAEVVEANTYPEVSAGTAMPLIPGLILSVKFFGVVILGNLLALVLLLVPGINIAAFFVVNGYLLGREYFEFAAMRYRTEAEAKALRGRYGTTVFLAGLLIAGFLAVPLLNLLTPLFAAALMVHLHQRVSRKEGGLIAGEATSAARLARG
ncbi:sulfate transporter family protein [Aurantimonas sp. A3-2-R12]|uniref:sulfate transporter family protein n=1 Tax=Aurantimonas sp. A3-2-R12 TaxID=3114362 RepID=UPI002E180975|nr:sulfate transporter family protein [Aurantimonas sp. A3-2-R12]